MPTVVFAPTCLCHKVANRAAKVLVFTPPNEADIVRSALRHEDRSSTKCVPRLRIGNAPESAHVANPFSEISLAASSDS